MCYILLLIIYLTITYSRPDDVPDSFIFKYTGQDQKMKDVFEKKILGGEFVQQDFLQNGAP